MNPPLPDDDPTTPFNLEQEVSQSQPDGSLLPTSDPTGFRAAPAHYSQEEREVIDQCRDMYPDPIFAAFCHLTAFIYRKRAPFKGTPEEDSQKAYFYEKMRAHVLQPDQHPDPRSYRQGLKPYERPKQTWAEEVEAESQAMTVTPTGPITVTMPLEGDYIIQADPWPPMSWEQVVELHEALVSFLAGSDCSDEDVRSFAAHELKGTLKRLHIGTPPAPPLTEPPTMEVTLPVDWPTPPPTPMWDDGNCGPIQVGDRE